MTSMLHPERLAAVRATGLLDTGAEEAFDRLARLAAALLAVPYAFVTIVDEQRSFWKSCIGVDSTELLDRQNSVAESFCQYVIASDEALVVADARLDPVTRSNPSIESMGVVAWAGYPLRSAGGHVLGTFCAVDIERRDWSERELDILSTLASAAEGEIQLRTLLMQSETASRAMQQEMLVRERLAILARSLSAADSTDAVAASITASGPAVLDAAFANVALLDGDQRQLLVLNPPSLDSAINEKYQSISLSTETPLGDAVTTGEAVLLGDHDAHHPRYTHLIEDAAAVGLIATAAVPLFRTDGGIVGALGIGWSHPVAFSSSDLALMTTVSLMCAQAIERSQLGDMRRELVRSLQQQLLPAIPHIEGLESAVRYIPANHGLGFGGDWYDIIALGGGRAAVIVGDIAGHGIEAASRMAQVRAAINALTRIYVDDLASICDAAEEMLAGLDEDYIATLAIFVLDPATGEIRYVSAGHPPAVIAHADGSHDVLEGGRRPLLGRRGPRPEIGVAAFPVGSLLVGFTDGLVEDRQCSMDRGIGRLAEILRDAAGRPGGLDPATVTDLMIHRMLDGRTVSDDVALIAVRRSARP